MLSWAVKTETAENTDQGSKWLLSEIKDVWLSYTAVKWAWQSLLIMNVCNNASAVFNTIAAAAAFAAAAASSIKI